MVRGLFGTAAGAGPINDRVPSVQLPFTCRIKLFRQEKGRGAALFSVPMPGGRVALVDPKTDTAYFAKVGANHSLSAVKGPVTLIGTPAAFQPGRYFTWENLKLMQERATFG